MSSTDSKVSINLNNSFLYFPSLSAIGFPNKFIFLNGRSFKHFNFSSESILFSSNFILYNDGKCFTNSSKSSPVKLFLLSSIYTF